MHLTPSKQVILAELLHKKQNVDRFKKRRGWESLSLELGVSVPTLRDAVTRGRRCGKLTPEQMEYAKLMRSEYEKHRPEFEEWTPVAIAALVGVYRGTVYQWERRMRGLSSI